MGRICPGKKGKQQVLDFVSSHTHHAVWLHAFLLTARMLPSRSFSLFLFFFCKLLLVSFLFLSLYLLVSFFYCLFAYYFVFLSRQLTVFLRSLVLFFKFFNFSFLCVSYFISFFSLSVCLFCR